jgi:hypothetical protein
MEEFEKIAKQFNIPDKHFYDFLMLIHGCSPSKTFALGWVHKRRWKRAIIEAFDIISRDSIRAIKKAMEEMGPV